MGLVRCRLRPVSGVAGLSSGVLGLGRAASSGSGCLIGGVAGRVGVVLSFGGSGQPGIAALLVTGAAGRGIGLCGLIHGHLSFGSCIGVSAGILSGVARGFRRSAKHDAENVLSGEVEQIWAGILPRSACRSRIEK